jgi:amino acid permease
VENWSLTLICLFMLLSAVALMASHVRTWRRVQQHDSTPDELDYHRRQYRRRMQTSALLGLLAVAIFVGQLVIVHVQPRLLLLAYWGAVLLLICWMALLAVADILATKHHFGRLRQTCIVEQAKLQAKIRRIRAVRGNGKPPREDHQPDTKH